MLHGLFIVPEQIGNHRTPLRRTGVRRIPRAQLANLLDRCIDAPFRERCYDRVEGLLHGHQRGTRLATRQPHGDHRRQPSRRV